MKYFKIKQYKQFSNAVGRWILIYAKFYNFVVDIFLQYYLSISIRNKWKKAPTILIVSKKISYILLSFIAYFYFSVSHLIYLNIYSHLYDAINNYKQLHNHLKCSI